jgi:hypothetical protein
MIVASFAILVAGRVYRVTRPPTPSEELEPLRQELALFRASVDTCTSEYQELEASFTAYERQVDSLRQLIREFESLDPEGVPGDRYAEYLEVFDAYNNAVPDWDGHTRALEAQRSRCESLTVQHNSLADSARSRLIELGRWPEDTLPTPFGVDDASPLPDPSLPVGESAEPPP